MAKIFNPYILTVDKLRSIKGLLEQGIQTGDYTQAEKGVYLLRHYKDCFFCQAFRKSLTDDFAGCCDNCPVHKVGEETIGRKRPYNGCYVTVHYRDLVRMAYWFETDKCKASAEAIIKAINGTIEQLGHYRRDIDKDIIVQ